MYNTLRRYRFPFNAALVDHDGSHFHVDEWKLDNHRMLTKLVDFREIGEMEWKVIRAHPSGKMSFIYHRETTMISELSLLNHEAFLRLYHVELHVRHDTGAEGLQRGMAIIYVDVRHQKRASHRIDPGTYTWYRIDEVLREYRHLYEKDQIIRDTGIDTALIEVVDI